ncbi:MAG TPA: hypothetical protein VI248_03190 [Kineosporiaceae bacterium]
MTLSPHAGPGAGVPGPGAPIGPEPAVDDGPTLDQGLPETAALLRAALRSVADVVHPSPNGLERILARAHADEATLPAVTQSDAG